MIATVTPVFAELDAAAEALRATHRHDHLRPLAVRRYNDALAAAMEERPLQP